MKRIRICCKLSEHGTTIQQGFVIGKHEDTTLWGLTWPIIQWQGRCIYQDLQAILVQIPSIVFYNGSHPTACASQPSSHSNKCMILFVWFCNELRNTIWNCKQRATEWSRLSDTRKSDDLFNDATIGKANSIQSIDAPNNNKMVNATLEDQAQQQQNSTSTTICFPQSPCP